MNIFAKWMMVAACVFAGAIASASAAPTGWGASAAVDSHGRLWIAYVEGAGDEAFVMVSNSADRGASWSKAKRVNETAEPVSADGENRPKLAVGPQGDLYVSWTSPTSAHYTGDIRFARSLDAGETWSEPMNVHRDRQQITHRFESMLVDRDGRIWIAWIDKRDLIRATAAGEAYVGAAIYYAWSDDRGATWRGDYKLADHSCECCRIALANDAQGRPTAFWRHVFAGGERDHAFAVLTQEGSPSVERATYDRWRIDACPHHGPSLAYDHSGVRHAVWFNQVEGAGRAFYGQLGASAPNRVRALPAGATHADVATAGDAVVIAWKRFDGSVTRIESWISRDGGARFESGSSMQTIGASDQPRLVKSGSDVLLVWRRAEGTVVQSLLADRTGESEVRQSAPRSSAAEAEPVQAFQRTTLADIERSRRGREFWLVLWDLECTYCMKSLDHLARAQRDRPDLEVVTIATDSIADAKLLADRLQTHGVVSDAYAFGDAPPEALRYAVDPKWLGEKPRAYRYDASGERETINGVIEEREW